MLGKERTAQARLVLRKCPATRRGGGCWGGTEGSPRSGLSVQRDQSPSLRELPQASPLVRTARQAPARPKCT